MHWDGSCQSQIHLLWVTGSAGQEIQSWLSPRPLQNIDKLGMALYSGHLLIGEQRKLFLNIPWLPGSPSFDASQGVELRARLWRSPISILWLYWIFLSRFVPLFNFYFEIITQEHKGHDIGMSSLYGSVVRMVKLFKHSSFWGGKKRTEYIFFSPLECLISGGKSF